MAAMEMRLISCASGHHGLVRTFDLVGFVIVTYDWCPVLFLSSSDLLGLHHSHHGCTTVSVGIWCSHTPRRANGRAGGP